MPSETKQLNLRPNKNEQISNRLSIWNPLNNLTKCAGLLRKDVFSSVGIYV